jgi:hypothetical protein
MDVVSGFGEMQGRWPPDETVTAHNRNFHTIVSFCALVAIRYLSG